MTTGDTDFLPGLSGEARARQEAPCTADRHGTRAAYTRGCRCADARKANREYAKYRDRRTAHAALGGADPFTVPVADTRSILDQLRGVGWTLRRIEAETGVKRDHLSRMYGNTGRPLRRVRWATHQRFVALLDREPVVAPGALVDALPTWRRIRGLIALGYPKTWIAQRLDLGRAIQLGEYVVTSRNAEKVRALVDTYGATPGPSDRARFYAAARGWTPDLLWQADDDDLAVDTDVDEIAIERAMRGEDVPLTKPERVDALHRLITAGVTKTVAAERLHLSGESVNRLLAQANVYAVITPAEPVKVAS